MINIPKILALDPATSCGWAHSCGHSGVWDLSIRKDESSGMRLIRFEGKLREIYESVGMDMIAFEAPTVARGERANFDAMKLQTKLQAIIERLCELTDGLECQGVNLRTIKSHAGERNKEGMLRSAQAKWLDRKVQDDNEADALWLLDLTMKNLGLPTDPPLEQEPAF